MRRIIGLVLAMAVALSIALIGGFSVSAESNLAASDECINILKEYEGFSPTPYYDYTQWTVGYGTRCPSDKLEHYRKNGITEQEAAELLQEHIAEYNQAVNSFADKYSLTMTQNQFDALVLFSFNCGSGWTYATAQNFHKTMALGAEADPADVLYWFSSWSNAGGRPLTILVNRRLCEANMYLNGEYSTVIPENYNYVVYNAAGGEVESRIHAYDTSAEPVTPTYEGNNFLGWFTESTEGTQVTALDNSLDGVTLYAHWESNGSVEENPDFSPVTVSVTSNYVNYRKGPGTNYATIGQVNTGDQRLIDRVVTVNNVAWGHFDGGWICLRYTNFDEVKDLPAQEPTEPEGTEPEVTEPAPTEPEATEPAPTEPAPTEPAPTEPEATEPTEPAPTEPEPTEPAEPETVTGKVSANGGLNIRSGAGTGYGSVGILSNGASVEILEQKTVGSMIWGKISRGWISMNYVVLDSGDSEESNTGNTGTQTDAVTGYIRVSGGLNIRSGAGTSYSIIGSYSNGNKVTITQQQTDGSVTWGKTDRGWISMNYFVADTGENNATGQPQEANATVNVSDVLRIRSGPGTSYAIAGYYNNGTRVNITETKTVGNTTWGKTSKGWISMDYVTMDQTEDEEDDNRSETEGETESTEPAADVRTVTANCLNVRSAAGTGNSVVGYLYSGAKVQILEESTVDGVLWGKISTGWICLQYTT